MAIDEKKLIEQLTSLLTSSEMMGYLTAFDVVQDCIEMVEKQPKADWISCEERLPENLEEVLVWYEYFRYGDYNCMYETYGIGYHLDGFWSGDVSGHKARCIAWQPLPKEYKKEGADNGRR